MQTEIRVAEEKRDDQFLFRRSEGSYGFAICGCLIPSFLRKRVKMEVNTRKQKEVRRYACEGLLFGSYE
jgi:hypothetical protein